MHLAGADRTILKTMTKLQIRFVLESPLTETQLARLSDVHAIYGLLRAVPEESLAGVMVEYDASRVSAEEVEAALHRAGIPVRQAQ